VEPLYVALSGWSPSASDAGTVTLNWNSPGATKPAKSTVAPMPPISTTGSGDKLPDCTSDPLTTGTLVAPKPLA